MEVKEDQLLAGIAGVEFAKYPMLTPDILSLTEPVLDGVAEFCITADRPFLAGHHSSSPIYEKPRQLRGHSAHHPAMYGG